MVLLRHITWEKSPCDGVGGTVKREVARASLQATTTGFLLTPATHCRH